MGKILMGIRAERKDISMEIYDFIFSKSQKYGELFALYRQYLEERFPIDIVRSIFFHEVVHWLRLLPHKIKNKDKRFLHYYACMIIVFNEVLYWYG